jgi:uncharacterized membrane protein
MTKTLSFGIVHFSVAFGVVYLLTGSLVIGSAVALIEPIVNTVAYHYHEKAWTWFRNRQRTDGQPVAVLGGVIRG